MTRALWVGVFLAAAGLVGACSNEGSATSTSAGSLPTTVVSTTADSTTAVSTTAVSTTAVPTTQGEVSSGSVTVESVQYPYAFELPADAAPGSWDPASLPWDGKTPINMAGPYLDVVFLPERSLLLLGTSTTGDIETFFGMMADNASRAHGCSEPENRRDVMIGEVPAVAYTQACENGALFARLALVHNDFGIYVFSAAQPGQENDALDEMIAALEGLVLE